MLSYTDIQSESSNIKRRFLKGNAKGNGNVQSMVTSRKKNRIQIIVVLSGKIHFTGCYGLLSF